MINNLNIQGDANRGKEIIELLEMLGGIKAYNIEITESNANLIYRIRLFDNFIIGTYPSPNDIIMTIEEFWEKFPYKIGDKVKTTTGRVFTIGAMKWSNEENTVKYTDIETSTYYTVEELTPYMNTKQIETTGFMQMGKTIAVCFNKENYENEVELQLGDYEIEVRDGKTFAVLKKPSYPKTFTECCKILGINPTTTIQYTNEDVERGNTYLTPLKKEFNQLLKLRICRDAYWKIAGEEMGLGKNWEPDWNDTPKGKYCIFLDLGEIACDELHRRKSLLAFPTEEMCDAFFENFKNLIDDCKEFL